MAREIEEHFDEIIPGAADRANQFLGVVRDRCNQEGIGIELRPHEFRRSKRLVLRGHLQVGKLLRKSRPMQIEVFADPVGSSLQVGWQLTKEGAPEMLMGFNSVARGQMMQDKADYSPENVRQLNAILGAFHQTVFRPVLFQLTDALDRQRQSGGGGFLGAT